MARGPRRCMTYIHGAPSADAGLRAHNRRAGAGRQAHQLRQGDRRRIRQSVQRGDRGPGEPHRRAIRDKEDQGEGPDAPAVTAFTLEARAPDAGTTSTKAATAFLALGNASTVTVTQQSWLLAATRGKLGDARARSSSDRSWPMGAASSSRIFLRRMSRCRRRLLSRRRSRRSSARGSGSGAARDDHVATSCEARAASVRLGRPWVGQPNIVNAMMSGLRTDRECDQREQREHREHLAAGTDDLEHDCAHRPEREDRLVFRGARQQPRRLRMNASSDATWMKAASSGLRAESGSPTPTPSTVLETGHFATGAFEGA